MKLGTKSIRIIGIDPGSIACGIGIVEKKDSSLRRIHSETVHCGRGAFSERLEIIYSEISRACATWEPDAAAIEGMFFHRNADSALKLGQARGVAMLALIHAKLPVTEIAPTAVKKSIGAFGRAKKEQVRSMVQLLLNYREDLGLDESDALAIAIARIHQNPQLSRKTL